MSVTLPEPVAEEAFKLAQEQGVDLDEVFRQGILSLKWDRFTRRIEAARPQESRDAEDRQMEEVYRLIEELRRQDDVRKSA